MRVVDGEQQGPLLGGVREQAQRRHRDAEPVARPGPRFSAPSRAAACGRGRAGMPSSSGPSSSDSAA